MYRYRVNSMMSTNRNVLEFVRDSDFIEYYIFPANTTTDNKDEELMINSVLREVNVITKKYKKDYIWHRDEFKLVARTALSNNLCNEEERENIPAHLYGVTHFGDNIEDEWFIVYLLMQLTKEINGIIVRAVDVDNEFLLIEAADFLPTWAKPEICSKRVYMYDGKLHIVAPLENEADNTISVVDAIQVIRNNPSITVASHDIQEAIRKKIKGYPNCIKDNLHRTKAYLPVAVAAILEHNPNLIAPAVLAFCNRDSIDLRSCRAMKYFPPEDRVYTSVVFTKFLYAMITHSKYMPEKRIGWELPPATSDKCKPCLLGVKIACGFEILASQAKSSPDIEGDKAWHTYLNSLKAKNYFRDLLEHSEEYVKLLASAQDFYRSNRDSMHSTPAVGQQILTLARNLDKDRVVRNENCLPDDDNEDWLNVSAEDLDKMLQERYGSRKTMGLTSKTDSSNFTRKITNFLEHISTVDGAEFPEAEFKLPAASTKPQNAEKIPLPQESTSMNVNFDSNSFSCAVQNILNFVIPEDDSWDIESDSDMDDYGQEDEAPMDYGELKSKMKEYMEQMDAELAQTTIGQSFVDSNPAAKEDNFDDIENFKPIDIDMNALKNVLESYRSQLGDAGPSSTMLGPMGIQLEKVDSVDSE